MKSNNLATVPTSPVIQPAAAALPADQAKRLFVPPQLVKQGKVTTITQGGGVGFGSDNIVVPP